MPPSRSIAYGSPSQRDSGTGHEGGTPLDATTVWIVITLVSTVLLAFVAYERGRTPAWGLLGLVLGIFGLILGVIILVVIPSLPRRRNRARVEAEIIDEWEQPEPPRRPRRRLR